MNLYLISQDENNDYDAYDSAVVAGHASICNFPTTAGNGRTIDVTAGCPI